ncbi:zeta toxin family protein [Tellurirhabdus rosea]|uniref:zeta toxin family protein n=1 Tax=Tellurirhabdus rosea TaxID=2674997 RepID=UPI00224CF320|nr:zeta toxin family protein [Tellurirhabdus rosea]
MPDLFIISGCNGAGKTTASYTVLPELLEVREFVNADEIARGLSPFQPEKVSIEAGKIMLRRMSDLIAQKEDFAFETTLSTRSFVGLIHKARLSGYTINLIYYWLDSVELAKERVRIRVAEGGHNIPEDTITRRYYAGIKNFIHLYKASADYWLLIDNSQTTPQIIAESNETGEAVVTSQEKWDKFNKLASYDAR